MVDEPPRPVMLRRNIRALSAEDLVARLSVLSSEPAANLLMVLGVSHVLWLLLSFLSPEPSLKLSPDPRLKPSPDAGPSPDNYTLQTVCMEHDM